MPAIYNWKTAALIRETPDSLTIVFDTGSDEFTYKPGQFVNLSLYIENKKQTRSYSLSSSPDGDEKPAITVKQVDRGWMSGYILGHAEEIEEWMVEGPHGQFYPDFDEVKDGHIVLIGGGSGITPLYSILKYALKQTSVKLTVIDANRSVNDIIFGKALKYLENNFPDRLEIWHAFSRSQPGDNASFRNTINSRLGTLVLKKILKRTPGVVTGNSYYFICGPAGLVALAQDTLHALGVPDERIWKEYFIPPKNEEKEFELPETMHEVLLHYYEQSNLLEVSPGKTILESALEDRIPIPYSCRNGTCGSCVGKLLAGNAIMKKNYSLPREMVEKGYILLCQAHPFDNQVTVEVGGQT
jgi:ring-1,2-phenylacetyl-CoA epoxidase subunit PaaE